MRGDTDKAMEADESRDSKETLPKLVLATSSSVESRRGRGLSDSEMGTRIKEESEVLSLKLLFLWSYSL